MFQSTDRNEVEEVLGLIPNTIGIDELEATVYKQSLIPHFYSSLIKY